MSFGGPENYTSNSLDESFQITAIYTSIIGYIYMGGRNMASSSPYAYIMRINDNGL